MAVTWMHVTVFECGMRKGCGKVWKTHLDTTSPLAALRGLLRYSDDRYIVVHCIALIIIVKHVKIVIFYFLFQGFGRRVMEQQGWKDGDGLGHSRVGISEALENEGQHPHCKRGFGCV